MIDDVSIKLILVIDTWHISCKIALQPILCRHMAKLDPKELIQYVNIIVTA